MSDVSRTLIVVKGFANSRRFGVVIAIAASVVMASCQVPNPRTGDRIPYPTSTDSMVKTDNDVPYGAAEFQVLDVYRPTNQNGAALLWIHGGGWGDTDGNASSLASEEPSGMQPLVPALYKAGWTVFSVRYAGTDEAHFPQQLYDVKFALRWVKAHAGLYGVHADSVVAMGWSAGAHLAALLGTTAGTLEPATIPAELAGVDDKPAAVVSIEGVLDPATFPFTTATAAGNASAVAALVGCPSSPALWQRCNAAVLASTRVARYADATDAPMFVIAADRDAFISNYYQALVPLRTLTEKLGADHVWFDNVDTGTAKQYGGVDPRNHTMAVSYEVNFTALRQFLAGQVSALG